MSDCEVEVGEWRSRPHYHCHRCNIRTLSNAVVASRCQATGTAEPLTTVAQGLLGPDGDPIPTTEPEPLGGGWYQLPNGERVQGKDAAEQAMSPTAHDQQ